MPRSQINTAGLDRTILKHLAVARSSLGIVDALLRSGIADRKQLRLCDDAAMSIGSLQILLDGEKP